MRVNPQQIKINPRGINHVGGVSRWAQNVSTILLENESTSIQGCPGINSSNHFVTRLAENLILPRCLESEDFLVSLCNWGPIIENQLLVIHDVAPLVHPEYFSNRYQQFVALVLPKLAKKVRTISTVSELAKKDICEKLNIPEEKVIVVGAASSLSNIKNRNSKLSTFDRKFMLFLGGHDPRKNLKFLTGFWPEIYNETGISLYFTSNGNKSIFKDQNLSNIKGVKHIGHPDDIQMAEYIKNASCLLSPSFYEGFGMPVIEALSLGTPVIATRTGVVGEICSVGLSVVSLESEAWKRAILSHKKIPFEFEWHSWNEVSAKILAAIAHVA